MTLPDVDEDPAMAMIEERGDFDVPGEEGCAGAFVSVNDVFSRVPG